jgi:two-component system sensor histidine kinase KdpD
LTAIATAAGTLRNEQLSLTEDDRRDLLESIEVETQRLNRLVANLLDMSRLQGGAAAPERELWTIDAIIRQAVDDLGDSDRIRVTAADAPPVRVDAAQIERVLVNLLENALKFSAPGTPVHIRVTTTRAEVIVRVVDQGPGIPAGELERVFEAFYRRGREDSGAGLGLAIAHGFAEANGGRLWAESMPGQGATFALALPAVSVPAEVTA